MLAKPKQNNLISNFKSQRHEKWFLNTTLYSRKLIKCYFPLPCVCVCLFLKKKKNPWF